MKRAVLLAAASAVVAGLSGAASAQDRNVNLSRDGSVHGRINAGALIINDIDFSSGASAQGITVNANGTIIFDPGLAVSGAVGYRINRYFAVEAEFDYAQAPSVLAPDEWDRWLDPATEPAALQALLPRTYAYAGNL